MTRLLYISSTLLAVTAHTLCCLLPLLTAMLGMGNYFGPLNWLAQHQGYVLGGQVLLLGWSFYHVYGPGRHAHPGWGKAALWSVTVVSVGMAVLPHSEVFRSEESRLAREQMRRVRDTRRLTFVMNTSATPIETLRSTLSSLPGIVSAQTQIQGNVVSLRYRTNQTNREKLLATLRRKGYVVQDKPAESLFLTETNRSPPP